MPLLQLPPEILILVMNYVGSAYFRKDVRRLTVCKYWFVFAHASCFKHLRLSQAALLDLLFSQNAERGLLVVQTLVESLDLELKGFENWNRLPAFLEYLLQGVSAPDIAPSWDKPTGCALRAEWTVILNRNLTRFAAAINSSRKLRVLRIHAFSERHPLFPLLQRRNYLMLPTVRDLLSVSNLRLLDLDLCGTTLTSTTETPNGEFHICASIGTLLPTLKGLRLRMRSICADVLKPLPHKTNLNLKEVLINLSLFDRPPLTSPKSAHSARCGSTDGAFLTLKTEIKDQAKALSALMAYPQKVRILTHKLPGFEIRSFDVMTGKSMILPNNLTWGDDGKIVNEEDPDQDSEFEI
ncbi:hypothetical protein LOZ12_005254 [Ophidiomyces ophidiicola]|uniref:Uncharacterized protein n=1 Tax=Ophidiomyces ophidiicola TaxID=1387563 RepID=A0ACB8UZJ4_9EURO|nr:uncharacterized protein LOZ57_002311 [Ophidiomyces ophidiicola]KAI1913464.1 hypothetical protein LOZ61_002797 [Ophidiomyces ophidiicola]KAI1919682.1 hypothetical protein LOZ64_002190 [Ophidiomyces ophidiicola]KAI1928097.1 hypothetical protein LOZ60_002590 [Ophidiomyces ophidiicola]KAI1936963.1 hypothetical protein LOZ62_005614 [Ophidiomyces ophidiicola]KAI1949833.1 hypothetical protein LOZ57_002311 [Ophidiomyces ophidiicola]